MKEYRLGSNALVHTPGILRFARRMYQEAGNNKAGEKDRERARDILGAYTGFPYSAAKAFLQGKLEFVEEEDGTAVFTVEDR